MVTRRREIGGGNRTLPPMIPILPRRREAVNLVFASILLEVSASGD
ncbi:unnamed protein product [Arabidopsis halleri]